MTRKHQHKGGCHCGNIHFTFETDIAVAEILHRCCTCRFCTKQGPGYTSDPKGVLKVAISRQDNVIRYRFGHKTADFIICKTCGVMPYVTSDIEGNIYGVLNVNCLDDSDQLQGDDQRFSFDMEQTEDRLARRKKRWIGKMVFT